MPYDMAGVGTAQMARLRAVWGKGRRAGILDSAVWRLDAGLNLIKFSDYGDPTSEYGWIVDHFPERRVDGGTDEISNLRPLSYKPKPRRSIAGELLAAARPADLD